MVRSASLILRQTLNVRRSSSTARQRPPHKGPKHFLRQVDETGEEYYRPLTKRERDGSNQQPDRSTVPSFEISNLLLDLDAEGSKYVRPFEEADYQSMTAAWKDPEYGRIRGRVSGMKKELEEHARYEESRQAKGMHFRTRETWITQYDVLSAALRGPGSQLERQRSNVHGKANNDAQLFSSHRASLRSLRHAMIIPYHALRRDDVFMEWLLLRMRKQHQHPPLPPAVSVANAIAGCTDAKVARRVLLQYYDVVQAANANDGRQVLPHKFIDTIANLCDPAIQSKCRDHDRRLALQLIGSLLVRFSDEATTQVGPLIRMGLLLSARLGEFAVTHEYLSRSLQSVHAGSANDVVDALGQVRDYIADSQDQWLSLRYKHQQLFDILVDTEDGSTFGTLSFRTFIASCLNGQIPCLGHQACDLVKLYANILASIGATRLIWSERLVLLPAVKAVLEKGADADPSLYKELEAALDDALEASLAVSGQPAEANWKICTLEQNLQAEFQRIMSHED